MIPFPKWLLLFSQEVYIYFLSISRALCHIFLAFEELGKNQRKVYFFPMMEELHQNHFSWLVSLRRYFRLNDHIYCQNFYDELAEPLEEGFNRIDLDPERAYNE